MKVVILAGGYGTRLAEYTSATPKPMVEIGGEPILTHIMKIYKAFSINDFIIAAGYKKEVIINYYKNSKEFRNLKIIDTGKDTMTGGRLLRLKSMFTKNENFFMTYGDGLCDVDLNHLQSFHFNHKKLATVTAVHPPIKFGELEIENEKVKKFEEKPQTKTDWINGGFFVIEPEFLKFIKNDNTYLEREPLEAVTQKKQLAAFRHEGFWQCMDTKRDRDNLNKILKRKKNKF